MLTPNELIRYDRQIVFFGKEKQEMLKSKTVLQIGAGGLGSPLSLYLVSSGIGKIIIYENDTLDLSNLGRQILYTNDELNEEKAILTYNRLHALNPNVKISVLNKRFTLEEGRELLKKEQVDFIVDASDNFETKFTVNDLGIEFNIPFTIAGIEGTQGQLLSVIPHKTACYRCLFGDVPKIPLKKKIPVMGPTCGVVGSMEAMEVLKGVLNLPKLCTNSLMMINLDDLDFRKINFKIHSDCRCQK